MEACAERTYENGEHANGMFPHDLVRAGQAQFLEDARMCLSQRTNLLAHAPPGLGKTAVSLAASLESVRDRNGIVIFLTSRQSQHNIAIETCKAIWGRSRIRVVDLISRDDMCLARKNDGQAPCSFGRKCYFSHGDTTMAAGCMLDHPMHVQESTRLSLKLGTCPYGSAVEAISSADVLVCDYAQVFGPFPSILERTGRKTSDTVLIVDEAHNLPGRVMGSWSASLAQREIDIALSSPSLEHFKEDLMLLKGILGNGIVLKKEKLASNDIDDELKRTCGVDTSGLAEEMSQAIGPTDRTKCSGLLHFLYCWNRFGDGSIRYMDEDRSRVHCRLILPSLVTGPIFASMNCALVMSGTLHPPEMFADLLGIERSICKSYPSPFPIENRLTIGIGGVSSRYRLRNVAMYDTVARRLHDLSSSVPGNMAVFFPSYEFMSRVMDHMTGLDMNRTMLVERREYGKNEKDAILVRLKQSRSAMLLAPINGSFSEGVDFRDNILSAVIVVGFPVSPPSPETDAMRTRLERTVGSKRADQYVQTYPAISKVLQAAGRAIRSDRDKAAIVLMDDRYMLPSIRAAFPEDFEISCGGNIATRLSDFFSCGTPISIAPNVNALDPAEKTM